MLKEIHFVNTNYTLTNNSETFAYKTEEGIGFWLARDLQQLLGYAKWDNFKNVLLKAKTAYELSEQDIDNCPVSPRYGRLVQEVKVIA